MIIVVDPVQAEAELGAGARHREHDRNRGGGTVWYRHKTRVSLHDMQTAFRRARITVVSAAHGPASQNLPEAVTCTAAAA